MAGTVYEGCRSRKEKDVGKKKAGPRGWRAVHEAHLQGWAIPASVSWEQYFPTFSQAPCPGNCSQATPGHVEGFQL